MILRHITRLRFLSALSRIIKMQLLEKWRNAQCRYTKRDTSCFWRMDYWAMKTSRHEASTWLRMRQSRPQKHSKWEENTRQSKSHERTPFKSMTKALRMHNITVISWYYIFLYVTSLIFTCTLSLLSSTRKMSYLCKNTNNNNLIISNWISIFYNAHCNFVMP